MQEQHFSQQSDLSAIRTMTAQMHRMAIVRTVAAVLILVILVAALCCALPRANRLMTDLGEVSQSLREVDFARLSESITAITEQLQKIDFQKMAASVTDIADTGTAGIETALEAIGKLDIEKLNESIDDLHAIVQPLARLFGKSAG